MRATAPLDRRRLLQLAAASATTLWLPRSAWSQPRFSADPFALGVASGTPDATSAVLWTRLVAPEGAEPREPVTVRWEVAHDEAFTRIAASGQAQALPELAHSVHAEPGGLDPDRWYFYRFMTGDWASPVARTRTLPAPDAAVQKLRLAYASCQRWEHGFFSAWRHLRAENPDAVVFLGDYIYEYGAGAPPVRPFAGGEATTLADYRARHALYKTDPDLKALHAVCPWFMTWDDHEVQNDYAGDEAGFPGAASDPRARRAAAYQAYYEHMPVRAGTLTRGVAGMQSGAEMRIYSRHRLGKLGDLYLLDARQYRDRQVCNPVDRHGSSSLDPAKCPEWEDPKRTFLGRAQEQWLDAQFASAPGGWNLVGQSTLFGPRTLQGRLGPVRWNDGWDGYEAARRRFIESLRRNRVPNAVMLGGDVHENWVGHVKADYAQPASEPIGVEFCGTSITSHGGTQPLALDALARNPHFVFADAEHRGYGVVDVTPRALAVRLRGVERPERADSGILTLASFSVAAGVPRIERT
ncbi:MAG TPA: alkaline phosphatase D family protein [Ramlibacter sp.]|uniref:alkaline phosphatase D family protein n=1 Tax=Ramlibacter sp. TaxID=1917967 RepID=UPI002CAC00D6|nr:alkaline phosphatase D family protein [Ramlibacter sp.]HVZ43142.1 alkaline phosphatase D family protein [Ramlibacter sp.]